jgi:calcineurin-like phosphoesterase family protein
MDWFTADGHHFHRNILKLCNRPFADLDEMHAALIKNWNARVKKADTVYHLGDFCFGGHKKAFEIIEQLNGRIYFIPGGHDKWMHSSKWETAKFFIMPPLYSLEYKDRGVDGYPLVVSLCHYPLLSWDRSCHGSISLHGHCHGALKNEPPRSMDVGVDCHNYAPISLDDVILLTNSP